jgi:glycosyltransferase involved in cell wall biosynthesis
MSPPGAAAFPPSSHPAAPGAAPAVKRICLVTGELAGPDYNGGIGTANRGLALALRARGHGVDILYTRVDREVPFCFRGTFAAQVEAFARLGIRLMCIRHGGEWHDWLAKSWLAMEHLIRQRYDFVFFNDTHGTAYYPLLARRTGSPALAATPMAVVTHSATQWIAELNESPITTLEDVRLMELERRSIELADFVLSPSAYLLAKYRSYGWRLPAATFVRPNILPREERRPPPARRRVAIDELVFFGRLERRKGLWLFCEVLDRIKHRLAGRGVTFLGKFTLEDGESTGFSLLRRSAAWPFAARLLHGFDREQALAYLKGGRRLAVMPSREDNSPCAILECLTEGIPFIASGGSGGEELLAVESREDCLFEPTVEALARKLLAVLERGAVTAAPAFDPERNEAALMAWLEDLLDEGGAAAAAPAATPVEDAPAEEPAPLLLVLVPASLDPGDAAARIARTIERHRGRVTPIVLAADPAALAPAFEATPQLAHVPVVDVRSWPEIAAAAPVEGATLAALCHVTQPIGPDAFARARLCFAAQGEIAAVTGLVAAADAAPPDVAAPPHVSLPGTRRTVARHLVGNAPALFPLSQETNGGFVLLRAELLPLLAAHSPFDAQYGRLERMGDWVHALLLSLDAQGRRFELLPDLALEEEVGEAAFEPFRLGRLLRALAGGEPGTPPGSEPMLLARLALEVALEGERRAAAAACLAPLAAKLGRPLDEAGAYAGRDGFALLAAMAQAAGQTELALELVAQSLTEEAKAAGDRPTLGEQVRRRAATISLVGLAAERRFAAVNLGHDWSFRLLADDRELEIHPNPAHEGRAAIVFRALDLARVERFTGAVRLANPQARPVRFRVDVTACDRSGHFSFERIVAGGETARFDVALPEATRKPCNVALGSEMADPADATRDAWARWVDPAFAGGAADASPGVAGTEAA